MVQSANRRPTAEGVFFDAQKQEGYDAMHGGIERG
jgi:hypothetical protein